MSAAFDIIGTVDLFIFFSALTGLMRLKPQYIALIVNQLVNALTFLFARLHFRNSCGKQAALIKF